MELRRLPSAELFSLMDDSWDKSFCGQIQIQTLEWLGTEWLQVLQYVIHFTISAGIVKNVWLRCAHVSLY